MAVVVNLLKTTPHKTPDTVYISPVKTSLARDLPALVLKLYLAIGHRVAAVRQRTISLVGTRRGIPRVTLRHR